jgi:hypothetical protein
VTGFRRVAVVAIVIAALAVLPGAYILSRFNQPEQVTGSVLAVRNRPPLSVDSFDLLVTDGRRLTFSVGILDLGPGGFDAPHLVTHELTAQPVIVTFRRDGARLIAIRLADGIVAAPASSVIRRRTPHVAEARAVAHRPSWDQT